MLQRIFFLLTLAVLLVIPVTGCIGTVTATSVLTETTTASTVDRWLTGQWTNAADRAAVMLDGDGRPTSKVPVGQWYIFSADGRYAWIARHVTFAIGGVMVEEGRVDQHGDQLQLTARTESFFPDEGSLQAAKHRLPIADATIQYRIERQNEEDVLLIRSGPDEIEIVFYRCQTR